MSDPLAAAILTRFAFSWLCDAARLCVVGAFRSESAKLFATPQKFASLNAV
jgi:hypothetical protein